jgi:elongation factor P
MKIGANDIRVGNVLEYNGKLWVVLKTMHVQPGKGGAYMQVEMKEIKEGTKQNIRFRSSETIEKADIRSEDYQYLYEDGDMLVLMNLVNLEQINVSKDLIGEQLPFMQEGMSLVVEFYGEQVVAIILPETGVFEVTECEPVVKGQTAASSYKPAILDNGVRIMVPPFVSIGDRVVVKIASQEYMERAKN